MFAAFLDFKGCYIIERGNKLMENADVSSKKRNAIFKIGNELYFYGFDELDDSVVIISKNELPILRSAKKGETPTFVMKGNVLSSAAVLDHFEKNHSLECLFTNVEGVYYQTGIYVDIDEVDFSSQFQLQAHRI